LQHENLAVRVLDQLERLGNARQPPAAPQQVELAACILAALRPRRLARDDLIEPIIRRAKGARRIERIGDKTRAAQWDRRPRGVRAGPRR
jgi:hypothetical protein